MTAIATAATKMKYASAFGGSLLRGSPPAVCALDRVFERDSAHRPLVPFMPLFSLSRRKSADLPNQKVFRTAA